MRKVFESHRIENVEAVAALLGEHGIDTRIRGGRGWRGAIRGNFSYRDQAQQREQPSLWVVDSNDQTRARQLLREAGLLPDPREARASSYLPQTVHGSAAPAHARPRGLGKHLRIVLIAMVLFAGGWMWFGNRVPPLDTATAPATTPAVPAPETQLALATTPEPYLATMPTALAALLVDHARDGAAACVGIDGADPAPGWIGGEADASLLPMSQCRPGLLRIHIGNYRTDGSGLGDVQLTTVDADGQRHVQHLRVEREGFHWRILGPSPPNPLQEAPQVHGVDPVREH